ncbi:RHS repeat-associated core domain-containing protein [Nonomuraea jabiensis]|uniref:RHS repeat-associated core domain-containing protein n=1 Tax=Nonomuraea jabiensis TaxID=882448 RepID=UPI003D71058E
MASFTTPLQSSTAYDPFGTVTALTGSKTNLGYQGEYTDPDTGKVNMHARWYQPGTGTFTSRDTAALTPSPSVQANRYTYRQRLTPHGHRPHRPPHHRQRIARRGGYSGFGYGDSGSSGGYTTIPAGGYSSSGWGCGSVIVDPEWARMMELEKEKKFWLGDDEVARLGWKIMPNGRPAPKNFFFVSELVQEIFMRSYDPSVSDSILQKHFDFLWERLDSRPTQKAWKMRLTGARAISLNAPGKNAVRHFLWQMSITHFVSERAAKEFGDAHEKREGQKRRSKEDSKKGACYKTRYAIALPTLTTTR